MNMFWFLSLMLLPLAALTYVAWHVWMLLPLTVVWRTVVVAMGVLCFFTLFLDFTGQLDRFPMPLARALYNIGTSSLIVMFYMFILFILLDIGRIVGMVPRSVLVDNWLTTLALSILLIGAFTYGRIHYNHKERVSFELNTAKSLSQQYRILVVSDLHLGYHNRRSELARWVDMMNAEQPDFILIAGDIVDISVRPLIEENMVAELRRLQAPVYACLGNHEYYASQPSARQFYKDAGIKLLIDESMVVDSSLVIIGRDDRTNRHRHSLAQLVQGADTSKFTILLDHQPHNLEEAQQAGIDLQLSGHTHRGQVWPISWISDRLFERSWGHHQRGQTYYYVSSGLGIWGGRFRIGTQSEYIVITVR